VAPSTTTTSTLPPGAGVVPPPPPAPPVPQLPDLAAKMARAATLEQQIVDQSTALDRLSDTYNKAREVELATDAAVADAVGQLTAGEAAAANAVATIASSEQALRRTALDGYLDMNMVANVKGADTLTRAYQQAIAQVYTGNAFKTGSQRIRDLHTAERNLRDIQKRMVEATKRAEAESAAAQAAALNAQAAVERAAGQQGTLLATLGQLQGGVGTLVDIQRASMALTAYQRISQAGSLLFTPSGPLPALLPETAAVLKTAIAQVGKPYVWGATGPDSFDCSGLTQWSWTQSGVGLPRVAADQQAWAVPVPISQVLPGDLVFFGNPAHHVGLYVGGGMMVEAPHTGAVVDITSVWWDDLAGFGRVHR
jgi:peptidoglycan DL-endopeptidase CwlO